MVSKQNSTERGYPTKLLSPILRIGDKCMIARGLNGAVGPHAQYYFIYFHWADENS